MFRQDFTCPALLVASLVPHYWFRVRGYHPLWLHFPEHSTMSTAITCGCSHFARHYFGNLGWFLFLQLLRCFSSPRSLCTPMYSVCNDLKGRVSPFGNLRINACLLAPRSLSQATTSFIAWHRQGIHHVHLFTCPYNFSFSFKKLMITGLFWVCLAFAVSKVNRIFKKLEITFNTFVDTITTHQISLPFFKSCFLW